MTRYEKQVGFSVGDIVFFTQIDDYSRSRRTIDGFSTYSPQFPYSVRGIEIVGTILKKHKHKTKRIGSDELEFCYIVETRSGNTWNISQSLLSLKKGE